MRENRTQMFNARIKPSLYKAIKKDAKAHGMSMTAWFEEAAARQLGEASGLLDAIGNRSIDLTPDDVVILKQMIEVAKMEE